MGEELFVSRPCPLHLPNPCPGSRPGADRDGRVEADAAAGRGKLGETGDIHRWRDRIRDVGWRVPPDH